MRKKKVLVGVASAKEQAKEFVDAWKRAEKGLPPILPIYRIYFENAQLLWKTVTPRRMELLLILRSTGHLSVRKLATKLSRDYKNVHTDVKELCNAGLIQIDKQGQLYVPWDEITLSVPLAA